MSRVFLSCAALAACALPGRAEPAVTSETVIRLSVQPMPAPRPALRYLLLPELKEMTPGNPIPNYLKTLFDQDFTADRENISREALRQADRAARMDRPDWQILPKLKTDGIGLLIPDVQRMRQLAADLQARFRDEVAQRRFDDAVGTAKTMFALSRHMSEHPTLIGDLVAIAIAFVAIAPLEEMLEQPGCPNLYWALTNLPNPLIALEKGMEGERVLIRSEFKDLDDVNPMTLSQIAKVAIHIDRLLDFDPPSGKPKGGMQAWLLTRAADAELVAAARKRLAEAGFPQARLARFPAAQAILLDEWREFEDHRDEVMKLVPLPAWQFEELVGPPVPKKGPGTFLFHGLVPALQKVRRAQGRLEQRVALLRHVEALRLYAAAHDGKLPARLSDVGLPLPPDPFTGKPFPYRVEGATAHLRGTPPPGDQDKPGFNVRYEVTIRK